MTYNRRRPSHVKESGGKVDTAGIGRNVIDEFTVRDLTTGLLCEMQCPTEYPRDDTGSSEHTRAQTAQEKVVNHQR
jgi:hypothetical protein